MTREQKITRARELREQGMSYPTIARELGVHRQTAYRWLNPETATRDRATSRAWKQTHREEVRAYDHTYGRTHRGRCVVCDGEMGIGIARDGTCVTCLAASRRARAEQVVAWWNAGESLARIASRLGWAVGSLASEMDWMRAQGFELPYRHHGERKGTKFPLRAAA